MIKFVILALATYRLSRMLAKEDGPLELFQDMRDAIDWRYPPGHPEYWLSKGINCPLCISFWIAPLLLVIGKLPLGMFALEALALSGVASFLYKLEPNE